MRLVSKRHEQSRKEIENGREAWPVTGTYKLNPLLCRAILILLPHIHWGEKNHLLCPRTSSASTTLTYLCSTPEMGTHSFP